MSVTIIHPYKLTPTVTTSGGTGSTTFIGSGQVMHVSVQPASGNPTYNLEITDTDGYGIFGQTSISGTTTFSTNFLIGGSNTLTISNASADGVFNIRLWVSYGT